MARSVGEAAALGLESGLRLAMDYNNQRDQKARQAGLDRMHLEDRAFDRTRIQRADARQQAVDAGTVGEAELNDVAQQLGSAGTWEQRAALARREKAARETIGKSRSTLAGTEFKPASQTDLDIKPFIARYQRGPNGEPSQDEAAAMKTMQSIEQGDMAGVAAGYNVLHRDSIAKIIGKKSPHGGTIVGARLEGIDPDPNSPKDNPRFFGRMKIWVRGEGGPAPGDAGPGDAGAPAQLQEDGAPPGATGYYFAPITEDRGTGPTAKVKSFSMKDEMDLVGQHLHLAELVNSEEGRAKLAEGGMTPQEWADLQARLAPRMPKKQETAENIGLGGETLRITKDATGKETKRETLQHTARPGIGARSNDPIARMQFQLDEIDAAEEAGELTKAQATAERRAVRSGIKPGKYTAGGTTTGSAGATGPGLKEREIARKERKDDIASLEKTVDAADKAADNARSRASSARSDLAQHMREKPDQFAKPEAISAWESEHSRLKEQQAAAEKRVSAADARHQEAIDAKKAGEAAYQQAKAAEEDARKGPKLGDAKGGSKAAPDLGKANSIKAQYKAGKLSREDAKKQLAAIGFD